MLIFGDVYGSNGFAVGYWLTNSNVPKSESRQVLSRYTQMFILLKLVK